jgi:hypothetical protein
MLANAVSQRAAWVLVLQALGYSVSDPSRRTSIRAGNAARLIVVDGVCFGHQRYAKQQLHAATSCPNAGKCCVTEGSVGACAGAAGAVLQRSDAARRTIIRAGNAAHLFRWQMGCLQRTGRQAATQRCSICSDAGNRCRAGCCRCGRWVAA